MGGVEGAAIRGPAVEGAACPRYPLLTRHGGSHLELCGFSCGPVPVLTSRFSCPALLKLVAFSTSRSPLIFYF